MFEKESNGMSEDERVDFVIALKRKMCLENGKVTDSDVYFQGVKDGYNKATEEYATKLKEVVETCNHWQEVAEKASEWHNLNENSKNLPDEGERVEGLYLYYYKDKVHWDVFKVRWYYEIGELDEKLVRWYSADESDRDYWNKVDEPDYWRRIALPTRNDYDRIY